MADERQLPEQSRQAQATVVEREGELAEIDRALSAAVSGGGWLLVFEGPAGIGKTTLLRAARERAARRGVTLALARGGELEGGFPYGVARQLFEPILRAADDGERERLLEGAAALAAPAVLEAQAGSALPDSGFAAIHGLYWLAANVAARAPLALVVDDVQWSDAPTLRWLLYLARRLDGLAVSVIASVRTGEDGVDPGVRAELVALPGARVLAPAALSETAVGEVLAEDFGQPPAAEFVRACRTATGGNPLLVHELAAALRANGIEPDAAASAQVLETGPRAIARSTLIRLGHISEDAVALARAVAVLGGDATLPRATALARLDEVAALRALDALLATGLLAAGERFEFAHPVVRAAIYDELPPGERSLAHDRVAAVLAAEGAPVDAVAAHAMQTAPTGSPRTVATLRGAAAHALSLGAPDSAAAYLARALREGCGRELRATLLFELASAEKLARNPASVARFDDVHAVAQEPALRVAARLEQVDLYAYVGRWEQALAVAREAFAEADGREPALAVRAQTMEAVLCAYDPRLVEDFDRRFPELVALAESGAEGTWPLALLLAGVCANRSEHVGRVPALVELGWDGGRHLPEPGNAELLPQILAGLVAVGDLEAASVIVEATAEFARERGAVFYYLVARGHVGLIETRRGNLVAAAAELRAVCERSQEIGLPFGTLSLLSYCVEVLVERPDVADLAELALTIDAGPFAGLAAGAMLSEVRARLYREAGRTAEAVAELRGVGELAEKIGIDNPNGLFFCWRSRLASMLGPQQREEALELVAAELAAARRSGPAGAVGVVLRAQGVVTGGEEGRAHLAEAVAVLAESPARLEYARALVELGAARRRAGERAAAREPLREGLDLAERCGAVRLGERARTELAATGGRPRRPHLSGREALTPSELRVAQLAAEGRTSREIAQTLFVTTKTVDAHLGHVYSKLGIGSRRALAGALGEDTCS